MMGNGRSGNAIIDQLERLLIDERRYSMKILVENVQLNENLTNVMKRCTELEEAARVLRLENERVRAHLDNDAVVKARDAVLKEAAAIASHWRSAHPSMWPIGLTALIEAVRALAKTTAEAKFEGGSR